LIEGKDRAIKDVVIKTLSPMGSSKAPRCDFCLNILAAAPSRKSVEIAMRKTMNDVCVFPDRMKYKKTGLKMSRDRDMILGIVKMTFLLFFLIVSSTVSYSILSGRAIY